MKPWKRMDDEKRNKQKFPIIFLLLREDDSGGSFIFKRKKSIRERIDKIY